MQLIVSSQKLLTENSTLKSVYLLSLHPLPGQILDYQAGDWLAMQAQNPPALVEQLLQRLNLTPEQLVTLPRLGQMSVHQALSEALEITQLNPAILNKLQRQLQLGDWPDRTAMMAHAYGRDILDLLDEFPQLAQMGGEFLNWLSPLAPRYYSIASASTTEIRLLYKAVRYHFLGRDKQGAASCYLAERVPGDLLHAQCKPNPLFKLPKDPKVPIIMVAAGTGLAPFLGFMQARSAQQAEAKLGENWLFFGETERAHACLACDELTAWQAEGQLQLHCVFSRDGGPMRYVQDIMQVQEQALWTLWQAGAILYVCGSQQTLAPAIEALWCGWFEQRLGLDPEDAYAHWQTARKQKRIQLDVY
ncbi:MAG: NADP oxidoreductase [Thiotrichales bacterium]|nr:NADP oxidoreductase [Thiotrichales bacterium]